MITENGDEVFINRTDDRKIRIMINDGDGEGLFTNKEAKELIKIIQNVIKNKQSEL